MIEAEPLVWKDYKISRVKDIIDVILTIDDDDEIRQFIEFMTPRYPVAEFINWILWYTQRLSPDSPQWLGAVDRERIKLALRYASS